MRRLRNGVEAGGSGITAEADRLCVARLVCAGGKLETQKTWQLWNGVAASGDTVVNARPCGVVSLRGQRPTDRLRVRRG